MVKLSASCVLSGDSFSPRLAEQRTGLRFTETNEPGEIGIRGRYKGQPRPYGMAILEAPFDNVTRPKSIMPEEWIVDTITLCIAELRACGASSIYLNLVVAWKDQCNLGFGSTFLSKLGQLNIDLALSCYEGSAGDSWTNDDDDPMNER